MIRRRARSDLLPMLIVLVIGVLGTSCNDVEITPRVSTPTLPTPEKILVGISPSRTVLNSEDEVVIAVISDEWRTATLTWDLTSIDMPSPGKLSGKSGPIVTYTAPDLALDGSGKVNISVNGETRGRIGRASVSFSIQPRGTIAFWTFAPYDVCDSARAKEFKVLYPGFQVKIESKSPEEVPGKLSAAIASGTAPDVVRFPQIDKAQAFGQKGLLDAQAATLVIRESGTDKFDPGGLTELELSSVKAQWAAIPTKSMGTMGITSSSANKNVGEAWVTFLIQREFQRC